MAGAQLKGERKAASNRREIVNGTMDIFIQPDIRRHRITVTVFTSLPGKVRVEIEGAGSQAEGDANAPLSVDFPDYELWQPGAARLYSLSAEFLPGDGAAERARVPFAMRELTAKDERFIVNNKPLFIKATRLSRTPDPSANAAQTFARILEAGFNAAFISAAMMTEQALNAAAATGLALFVELDEADLESGLKAHRTQPAIVAWVVNSAPPDAAAFVKTARAIDPTRLLLVKDGGSYSYVRPYRTNPQPLNRVSVSIDHPPTAAALNLLRNLGEPSAPTLVDYEPATEGGLHVLDAEQQDALAVAIDLKDREGLSTSASAIENLARRIETLRANAKVAAYIVPDVSALLAEPGSSAKIWASANAPLLPIIELRRPNLVPRQEIPVSVRLLNESRTEGRVDLSLQVVGPTQQVLWKKKRNVKLPKHGKELWSGTIAASGSTGPHRFVVRILGSTGLLAEASHPFDVLEPVGDVDGVLDLLTSPKGIAQTLTELGYTLSPSAPVILVPPLANTVRAYPDDHLARALGQARSGATAIIFSPPEDWDDFAEHVSETLCLGIRRHDPARDSIRRYARLHPVFDGLPARGLMGRHYANVAGTATSTGDTEEDICGSMSLGEEGSPVFGNDLVVRRYGSGHVAFVHLNLLDHVDSDPLAARLFDNLVKHFARRSMPSEGVLPVHQKSVEWLRRERAMRVRHWRVIGPFPNWGGAGHQEAYPPETEPDFDATYPGWYAAVYWRTFFTVSGEAMELPFDRACRAHHRMAIEGDAGTYYAYAEVASDRRGQATLRVDSPHAIACWVNKSRILGSGESHTLPATVAHEADVSLRQGRNTILLKVSKTAGDATARVSLDASQNGPGLRWWS